MSRATWHNKIASKFFHVYYYRKLVVYLISINVINLALILAVVYVFINRAEPIFYASNGYMPPIEILAMSSPNESSTPLLPIDQPEEQKEKIGVQ